MLMRDVKKVAWLLGIGGILASFFFVVQLSGNAVAALMAGASLILLVPASQKVRTQRARTMFVWAFFLFAFLSICAFAAHVWFLGPDSFAAIPVALASGGVIGGVLALRTRRRSSTDYIRGYFTE